MFSIRVIHQRCIEKWTELELAQGLYNAFERLEFQIWLVTAPVRFQIVIVLGGL